MSPRPFTGLVALVLLLAGSVRAAEIPVPGTELRVDASGYLDGLAVAELGGPRQRPGAIGELKLDSRLARWLRTRLTLRGAVGGPFEGGHPGLMNFVHEFQNTTPSLEFNEAYAELRTGDLQARVGIQKFAWGKLDGVPPTDVATPRDLHDPFVREYEESKIGIPAVLGTYYLPPVPSLALRELRASLAYIPFAVPARLALREERWFPPSVDATSLIVVPRRVFGTKLVVPITFETANAAPPKQFDAGGLAIRLGGTWREMDWDLYHYTGPETGPDADLVVTAFRDDTPSDVPGQAMRVPADSVLTQAHDTIHMTGADWSTVLGGATVRAEVAGFLGRPYLVIASDLFSPAALEKLPTKRLLATLARRGSVRVPVGQLFPDRNTVEWGVGADYLIGGFLPLLQVNQVVFVDDGPEELLSDPETRILASVRRRFFQETLEVELRSVYALERGAWFVFPRVSYRYGDHLRLRVGYLGIGGPLDSVIGQFHRNDEFVFEARYTF